MLTWIIGGYIGGAVLVLLVLGYIGPRGEEPVQPALLRYAALGLAWPAVWLLLVGMLIRGIGWTIRDMNPPKIKRNPWDAKLEEVDREHRV